MSSSVGRPTAVPLARQVTVGARPGQEIQDRCVSHGDRVAVITPAYADPIHHDEDDGPGEGGIRDEGLRSSGKAAFLRGHRECTRPGRAAAKLTDNFHD